jgi:hypothetical protein
MDPFPWKDLRQRRVDLWDEANLSLSLFTYRPRSSQRADEVTEFILGFKAYDPEHFSPHDSECFKASIVEVCDAFKKCEDDWKRDCRFVIPVPRHVARQVSPSSRDMCRCIAAVFRLEYPEELLFRNESVEAAHMARPWERRLSSMEHFQSLACQRADLAGAGVILFDDIRTSGCTSDACRRRLKQDTKCGEVIRLFLGRTEG